MFCHDCPAGITVPGAAGDRFGFPTKELRRSELYRARLRYVVDAVRPLGCGTGTFTAAISPCCAVTDIA